MVLKGGHFFGFQGNFSPLKTQKRKHYTSLLDVIDIRPEIGTTNVSNNLFIVLNRWLKVWPSAKNNNRLISVTRKIRLANHHCRFIDLADQKSFKQMIVSLSPRTFWHTCSICDHKILFRHKIWDFDQNLQRKECCQFYKLMKQFNIIQ